MKKNSLGLLEYAVGEVFTDSGQEVEVVLDDGTFSGSCKKCDYCICGFFACSPLEREDGVSVHFVRVEGGEK